MTTQKTTTSFHDRIPPSPIGHYPEPIYMPTWWDWITGRGDPILATSRLTVVLSILVIVSAGILGFTALHDLFISIDLFHPVLGYLFPILFDAAEVSFAISTLNAQLQGEENRFSWRMVITFTLLGISANIAHATFAGLSGVISQEQAILAVIFTSLFPLSIALVTHNLKNVIKLRIKRSTLLKTTEHLIHEIQQLQIQQQSLLRHQTQIEQQRAELNQQMDCDRQQGEAELADLIRQKEQLQQEIKSLKNERWAAKRGTDLVNDGIDAEPNLETEQKAYVYLTEQVKQGKRNREINGAELGREIGTSESFGRRLKKRLLPQIRTELGIPESAINENGTQKSG